jgi:hypothetical protein
MKVIIRISALLFVLTVTQSHLFAQSQLTLGAQYKPRFEYRHGFKTPYILGQDAAAFVEQRTRLWADFKKEKFQIHINVQDIRMWGSTNQIYKQDPSMFNAYEAYGAYFINQNWTVKIGRQALVYDNERFLGGLDWAMQGRSHDALRFIYNNEESQLKLHIVGAFNQFQTEPLYLTQAAYTNINYKNMAYVWLNKTWGTFNVSFLFHNNGRENVGPDFANPVYTGVEYHRQTVAIIPQFHQDNFSIDGEFYYQMGKNINGQDISAFFTAAHATLKTSLTPITLGAEYASGTAFDAANNVDNSWLPLYGTNHKFYGYMDYFYVVNLHGQASGVRLGGLIDLHLKTNFKFNDKNFLAVHLHQFLSPVEINDVLVQNQTVNQNLGTEVDLVYELDVTPGLVATVGYSHMFTADAMQYIKGIPAQKTGTNNWAWVQLNFSGDLFTFKN